MNGWRTLCAPGEIYIRPGEDASGGKPHPRAQLLVKRTGQKSGMALSIICFFKLKLRFDFLDLFIRKVENLLPLT